MTLLNLLSRTPKREPTEADVKEALAFFVLLMIYASSGEIDEDAIESSLTTLERCGLFKDDTRDDIFQLLVMVEKKVVSDDKLDEAAYFHTLQYDEWNLTALAMAADVMMSDGVSEDSEIELLTGLARDAQIGTEDLRAIYGTVHALRRA